MFRYLNSQDSGFARRTISTVTAMVFFVSMTTASAGSALAQSLSFLPPTGAMITPSTEYSPPILRGIKILPDEPLKFEFIIDLGDEKDLTEEEIKAQADKLIKYFLAALAVPDKELWVNLSPYERDRIITDAFGRTEMGRDLLAQDYILKQLTASLIHPEEKIGRKYWESIYQKAYEKFGRTDIPVNSFIKVWIIPERADVFESGDTAYILDAHMKVMLESDYKAVRQNYANPEMGTDRQNNSTVDEINAFTSEIVRETVIPEIEEEVNNGRNFGNLRQITYSMILAHWFKEKLKESFLAQSYADKKKVGGIALEDKEVKKKIYEQYVAALKEGVFNYIREDYDIASKQVIARRYYSGGYAFSDPDTTEPNVEINVITAEGVPVYIKNNPEVVAGVRNTTQISAVSGLYTSGSAPLAFEEPEMERDTYMAEGPRHPIRNWAVGVGAAAAVFSPVFANNVRKDKPPIPKQFEHPVIGDYGPSARPDSTINKAKKQKAFPRTQAYSPPGSSADYGDGGSGFAVSGGAANQDSAAGMSGHQQIPSSGDKIKQTVRPVKFTRQLSRATLQQVMADTTLDAGEKEYMRMIAAMQSGGAQGAREAGRILKAMITGDILENGGLMSFVERQFADLGISLSLRNAMLEEAGVKVRNISQEGKIRGERIFFDTGTNRILSGQTVEVKENGKWKEALVLGSWLNRTEEGYEEEYSLIPLDGFEFPDGYFDGRLRGTRDHNAPRVFTKDGRISVAVDSNTVFNMYTSRFEGSDTLKVRDEKTGRDYPVQMTNGFPVLTEPMTSDERAVAELLKEFRIDPQRFSEEEAAELVPGKGDTVKDKEKKQESMLVIEADKGGFIANAWGFRKGQDKFLQRIIGRVITARDESLDLNERISAAKEAIDVYRNSLFSVNGYLRDQPVLKKSYTKTWMLYVDLLREHAESVIPMMTPKGIQESLENVIAHYETAKSTTKEDFLFTPGQYHDTELAGQIQDRIDELRRIVVSVKTDRYFASMDYYDITGQEGIKLLADQILESARADLRKMGITPFKRAPKRILVKKRGMLDSLITQTMDGAAEGIGALDKVVNHEGSELNLMGMPQNAPIYERKDGVNYVVDLETGERILADQAKAEGLHPDRLVSRPVVLANDPQNRENYGYVFELQEPNDLMERDYNPGGADNVSGRYLGITYILYQKDFVPEVYGPDGVDPMMIETLARTGVNGWNVGSYFMVRKNSAVRRSIGEALGIKWMKTISRTARDLLGKKISDPILNFNKIGVGHQIFLDIDQATFSFEPPRIERPEDVERRVIVFGPAFRLPQWTFRIPHERPEGEMEQDIDEGTPTPPGPEDITTGTHDPGEPGYMPEPFPQGITPRIGEGPEPPRIVERFRPPEPVSEPPDTSTTGGRGGGARPVSEVVPEIRFTKVPSSIVIPDGSPRLTEDVEFEVNFRDSLGYNPEHRQGAKRTLTVVKREKTPVGLGWDSRQEVSGEVGYEVPLEVGTELAPGLVVTMVDKSGENIRVRARYTYDPDGARQLPEALRFGIRCEYERPEGYIYGGQFVPAGEDHWQSIYAPEGRIVGGEHIPAQEPTSDYEEVEIPVYVEQMTHARPAGRPDKEEKEPEPGPAYVGGRPEHTVVLVDSFGVNKGLAENTEVTAHRVKAAFMNTRGDTVTKTYHLKPGQTLLKIEGVYPGTKVNVVYEADLINRDTGLKHHRQAQGTLETVQRAPLVELPEIMRFFAGGHAQEAPVKKTDKDNTDFPSPPNETDVVNLAVMHQSGPVTVTAATDSTLRFEPGQVPGNGLVIVHGYNQWDRAPENEGRPDTTRVLVSGAKIDGQADSPTFGVGRITEISFEMLNNPDSQYVFHTMEVHRVERGQTITSHEGRITTGIEEPVVIPEGGGVNAAEYKAYADEVITYVVRALVADRDNPGEKYWIEKTFTVISRNTAPAFKEGALPEEIEVTSGKKASILFRGSGRDINANQFGVVDSTSLKYFVKDGDEWVELEGDEYSEFFDLPEGAEGPIFVDREFRVVDQHGLRSETKTIRVKVNKPGGPAGPGQVAFSGRPEHTVVRLDSFRVSDGLPQNTALVEQNVRATFMNTAGDTVTKVYTLNPGQSELAITDIYPDTDVKLVYNAVFLERDTGRRHHRQAELKLKTIDQAPYGTVDKDVVRLFAGGSAKEEPVQTGDPDNTHFQAPNEGDIVRISIAEQKGPVRATVLDGSRIVFQPGSQSGDGVVVLQSETQWKKSGMHLGEPDTTFVRVTEGKLEVTALSPTYGEGIIEQIRLWLTNNSDDRYVWDPDTMEVHRVERGQRKTSHAGPVTKEIKEPIAIPQGGGVDAAKYVDKKDEVITYVVRVRAADRENPDETYWIEKTLTVISRNHAPEWKQGVLPEEFEVESGQRLRIPFNGTATDINANQFEVVDSTGLNYFVRQGKEWVELEGDEYNELFTLPEGAREPVTIEKVFRVTDPNGLRSGDYRIRITVKPSEGPGPGGEIPGAGFIGKGEHTVILFGDMGLKGELPPGAKIVGKRFEAPYKDAHGRERKGSWDIPPDSTRLIVTDVFAGSEMEGTLTVDVQLATGEIVQKRYSGTVGTSNLDPAVKLPEEIHLWVGEDDTLRFSMSDPDNGIYTAPNRPDTVSVQGFRAEGGAEVRVLNDSTFVLRPGTVPGIDGAVSVTVSDQWDGSGRSLIPYDVTGGGVEASIDSVTHGEGHLYDIIRRLIGNTQVFALMDTLRIRRVARGRSETAYEGRFTGEFREPTYIPQGRGPEAPFVARMSEGITYEIEVLARNTNDPKEEPHVVRERVSFQSVNNAAFFKEVALPETVRVMDGETATVEFTGTASDPDSNSFGDVDARHLRYYVKNHLGEWEKVRVIPGRDGRPDRVVFSRDFKLPPDAAAPAAHTVEFMAVDPHGLRSEKKDITFVVYPRMTGGIEFVPIDGHSELFADSIRVEKVEGMHPIGIRAEFQVEGSPQWHAFADTTALVEGLYTNFKDGVETPLYGGEAVPHRIRLTVLYQSDLDPSVISQSSTVHEAEAFNHLPRLDEVPDVEGTRGDTVTIRLRGTDENITYGPRGQATPREQVAAVDEDSLTYSTDFGNGWVSLTGRGPEADTTFVLNHVLDRILIPMRPGAFVWSYPSHPTEDVDVVVTEAGEYDLDGDFGYTPDGTQTDEAVKLTIYRVTENGLAEVVSSTRIPDMFDGEGIDPAQVGEGMQYWIPMRLSEYLGGPVHLEPGRYMVRLESAAEQQGPDLPNSVHFRWLELVPVQKEKAAARTSDQFYAMSNTVYFNISTHDTLNMEGGGLGRFSGLGKGGLTEEEVEQLRLEEEKVMDSAAGHDFSVSDNFPNPFVTRTKIRYTLPKKAEVSVRIYNIKGELVREFSGEGNIGDNELEWDGHDSEGNEAAAGVYLVQISARGQGFHVTSEAKLMAKIGRGIGQNTGARPFSGQSFEQTKLALKAADYVTAVTRTKDGRYEIYVKDKDELPSRDPGTKIVLGKNESRRFRELKNNLPMFLMRDGGRVVKRIYDITRAMTVAEITLKEAEMFARSDLTAEESTTGVPVVTSIPGRVEELRGDFNDLPENPNFAQLNEVRKRIDAIRRELERTAEEAPDNPDLPMMRKALSDLREAVREQMDAPVADFLRELSAFMDHRSAADPAGMRELRGKLAKLEGASKTRFSPAATDSLRTAGLLMAAWRPGMTFVSAANEALGGNWQNVPNAAPEERLAMAEEVFQFPVQTPRKPNMVQEKERKTELDTIQKMQRDNAMAEPADASGQDKLGGIDLNPQNMEFGRKGGGLDADLNVAPVLPENLSDDGYVPFIFEIKTITNILFMLGVRGGEPEKEKAGTGTPTAEPLAYLKN